MLKKTVCGGKTFIRGKIKMNKKRVVITGMGVVTPVGIGVETYWKNLVDGQSGIRPGSF